MKTHITGCIEHGENTSFFLDLLQWPHDPNLVLSCMVRVLCNKRDRLPPKLYVQADNCGRENKNKFVIGFLGYLCLEGYLKEVNR